MVTLLLNFITVESTLPNNQYFSALFGCNGPRMQDPFSSDSRAIRRCIRNECSARTTHSDCISDRFLTSNRHMNTPHAYLTSECRDVSRLITLISPPGLTPHTARMPSCISCDRGPAFSPELSLTKVLGCILAPNAPSGNTCG